MDTTKQSVREQVYNFSFALTVFTFLLITKVLFQKAESVAYLCCAFTVGISNAYCAAGFRAGVTRHFCNIVNITMYQFYYDSHRLYMPSWIAYLPAFGVVCLLVFENCIVWVLCSGTGVNESVLGNGHAAVERYPTLRDRVVRVFVEVYQDGPFREKYVAAAHLYLFAWTILPLSGTGILRAPWHRLIVMVIAWTTISLCEHYKSRVCKPVAAGDFAVAHPAYKCAPLLYLPTQLWILFLVLVVWDCFVIIKYRRPGSWLSFLRAA